MMSQKTDEDEHSIEMQLAYIAKVMERCLQINKFQVTIFEDNFVLTIKVKRTITK